MEAHGVRIEARLRTSRHNDRGDRMTTALPLQLGEPVTDRGITIVPAFPLRNPVAEYVTLDDALPRGFRIDEASDGGSVPELLVRNPLDERVLLYDGEELIGAKQNRILNLSVLVDARAKTSIPVSCVEAGRWHRSSMTFAAADHTAGPELRSRKAAALAPNALARGAAQSDVWNTIAEKSHRLGVDSPTAAHSDLFRARGDAMRELADAFALQPGQCGMALVLPDGRACLDYLSRPEAFAQHHRKLLHGYLLDAIEQLDRPAAEAVRANVVVAAVSVASAARQPSAGLGSDVRIKAAGIMASGLELDGEVIQLSAYAA
jgi:ARG/rhodanese/phosphatase superfamily protein